MSDTNNKGGRIAKTASDYFGINSHRDAYFRVLKRRFGSVGVDIYLLILQLIAQSPFFLFPLNPVNLRRIYEEDLINPEEFDSVVRYCIDELEILDKPLYQNGYLFSVNFVRTFDKAGLFRHRKYNAEHILTTANYYRPGHPPLTIEDTLELIAQGIAPSHSTPVKDATKPGGNSINTQKQRLDENSSNQQNNQDDPDLPF